MNKVGETALHLAAQSELEGLEKVRFLVAKGANVNKEREGTFQVSFLRIVSEIFIRTCSQICTSVCTDGF